MHYYLRSSRGWMGLIRPIFRVFLRFEALSAAGHMPES